MPLSQEKLIEVFGDYSSYLRPDGSIDFTWENKILTRFDFPTEILVAGTQKKVYWGRCHYKISEFLETALAEIFHFHNEAWNMIDNYGGCYNWRLKRKSKSPSLSSHCWGISIDLDTADNYLGREDKSKMHPDTVTIFKKYGFEWGGNWRSRKDPMHFEFIDLKRL